MMDSSTALMLQSGGKKVRRRMWPKGEIALYSDRGIPFRGSGSSLRMIDWLANDWEVVE